MFAEELFFLLLPRSLSLSEPMADFSAAEVCLIRTATPAFTPWLRGPKRKFSRRLSCWMAALLQTRSN